MFDIWNVKQLWWILWYGIRKSFAIFTGPSTVHNLEAFTLKWSKRGFLNLSFYFSDNLRINCASMWFICFSVFPKSSLYHLFPPAWAASHFSTRWTNRRQLVTFAAIASIKKWDPWSTGAIVRKISIRYVRKIRIFGFGFVYYNNEC